MIQINPLKSYIDGGVRAAITSPPSASLVFDLPGRAIWVKGVKLKGTDHTYTFNHDNYINLTNTPGPNNSESEEIKIGININTLKAAIDTTYGVVTSTADGLAPKFSNGNKSTASAATTYHFLGWTGTTLKWYQAPWRNIRINSETTDCLGVNSTDPLIISAGNGINVTWDSTNKKIVITNSAPDVNHNTDNKVAQAVTTQNKDYPVILKSNDTDNGIIAGVNFSTYLKFNPSSKQLKINGNKVITVTDTFTGATASTDGAVGLVTKPLIANRNQFLRGDGTWATPTNTWRSIKVGGSEKLGSGTDTGSIDFVAGNGITLAWDATNKRITITNSKPHIADDTNTWRPIYLGGTIKQESGIGTAGMNLKAGSGVTITYTAPGTGSGQSGSTNYGTYTINASNQIPSDNVTGSGATNWIAKWSGEHTISKLVVISSTVTSQTQSTKFLREDGTWATPSYTTNSNTWRPVKVEGTEKLSSAINTSALDLSAGNGISIIYNSDTKKVVITNTKPDINHNTHYTTMMYIGENNDTKENKQVGNPYLKLFDDNVRRATFQIKGGTGITVGSDTNGNITITNSAPDVNHNTDEKVKQTPQTNNVDRPLMMINGGTSTGEQINTSIFSTGIYANASTKMITSNGFKKTGSSDSYLLLGGGGHKAISDLLGNYVTLNTTQTITAPKKIFKGTVTNSKDVSLPLALTLNTYGDYNQYVVGIGFSNESNGWYKSFIGYERTGAYDIGNIVFAFNLATDTSDATYDDIKYTFNKNGYLSVSGGFIKNNSSNNYVLLGGGDHKALSDFSISNHTHSQYVDLTSAQTITGVKTFAYNTFILAGIENSNIRHSTQPNYNWGGYGYTNTTPNNTGMYNSLDFYWYNDIWSIGNLRSGDSRTNGFGIGLKKTNNDGIIYFAPAFRVTETESYINNNKVWHVGNDGSNSGLDADLLDGNHASAFALTSHTHAYLPLSGGSVRKDSNLVLGPTAIPYGQTGANDWIQMQHTMPFEAGRESDTWVIAIGCSSEGRGVIQNKAFGINTYGILYLQPCGNVLINKYSCDPNYTLDVGGSIGGQGFYKNGSSNSYVLLGGGGHKAVSDFSMAHTHPYLPLSGGTMSGQILCTFGLHSWGLSYTGALQIRERDNVVDRQSSWDYAPAISFHWGARYARRLGMRSDGNIAWDDSIILRADNFNSYAPKLDGTGASGTWNINISGNALTATNADMVDGYHASAFALSSHTHSYLPLSGGTMTGSPYIYFPASVNNTNLTDNTPTGLTHGRLQSYETMTICGDTDGSTTEYVNITAGYSIANATAANGLSIGYNTLKWKGNTIWHTGNDGHGSGLDADLLDGYHASSFSLSTHTHTFNLGNTTITTNGGSYSGITGPFNIYTNANAANAFSIWRSSKSEGVQHWVDDGQYHIDYTNDETSSSIHIRIINTDTESSNKTNTTDYHYYLNCYGNFYPGSNNTGSIGTAGYKWANMYATTFHGSLDGNASTATSATSATQATNLTPENTAHYFRDSGNSTWRGGMYWGSAGSESMSFVVANSGTRFQFVGGSDIANWGSSTWQSAVPYMEINTSGTLLQNNNSWLTPARLQLMRSNTTAYTDRACIGVTDGNLHIDSYPSHDIYLNYYSGNATVHIGNYIAIHSGNISSQSVNYASSAGNADTLDGIDSTGFLRYYNSNAAPSNVDIVNTTSYVWTVSTSGGSVGTATKPSGMDNAWGVIHLHTHSGNYATQLGFGGTTGRMYMRNAYNTSSFGVWKSLAFSDEIPTVTNYYWANVKVSASSSTNTSPTFNTCYTSNWFRSIGDTGWYNESYGGGIYMEDTDYVRTYNSKAFYVSNTGQHAIYTAGGFASAKTDGSVFSTYYNGTWYGDTLRTHGNGNLSISAPGGHLYLSYSRGNTYFGGDTYYINRSGYFNGSVNYASSSGNADTLDNYHASSFALQGADNNLMNHGNEFTFVPDSFSGTVWFNYRTKGGTNGNIVEYRFGNGKGGALGTALHTGNYTSYCAPASHTHSQYLTTHQTIYGLTIQANGTSLGTYIPNSAAKTINITYSNVGAAAASHTHNYLPLSGGTMNANARISFNNNGNLYIGTEDNSGYVYFQDIASQDGPGYWCISQDGEASFNVSVTAPTFYGDLEGNASSATRASKLGSSTVGSGIRHFYLSAGTATASSATVGSASRPMYLKSGVMTACSSSLTDYLPLTGGSLSGDLHVLRTSNDASIWAKYYNKTAIRMVASTVATYIQCGNYAWTDSVPMYITGPGTIQGSTLYIKFSTIDASGSIYASHFYENSDIRYKKILRNLSINSNIIANLPLFDFEWIENNTIGTGTSAQAVQKILPNIVSGNEKLTLDYGVLGTIAGITACKELVKVNIEIFTQKSEIEQLKEKVKQLEDKLRKYAQL